MSLEERTIAEYLKGAGYRTALFEKWHLGFAPQFHPMERGFDEFFGFLAGAHSYSWTQWTKELEMRRWPPPRPRGPAESGL